MRRPVRQCPGSRGSWWTPSIRQRSRAARSTSSSRTSMPTTTKGSARASRQARCTAAPKRCASFGSSFACASPPPFFACPRGLLQRLLLSSFARGMVSYRGPHLNAACGAGTAAGACPHGCSETASVERCQRQSVRAGGAGAAKGDSEGPAARRARLPRHRSRRKPLPRRCYAPL